MRILQAAAFCAAVAYATSIVSSAPWAGPAQSQCQSVADFEALQVAPVLAAGIPILVLKDKVDVDAYISVVNAIPPVSNHAPERLYIGVGQRAVIIALVEGGVVCQTVTLGLPQHEQAMNAVMRGRA